MGTEAWLDDFLDSYFRRRPVCATFIGVHGHDDRFPDYSPAARQRKRSELQALRDRLETLPRDDLPEKQAIDRRLAKGALRIQLWENDSAHYIEKNPAFYTGKAVFGVLSLLLRDFAPIEDRISDASSRLDSIPAFLEQAHENLEAIPEGWVDRASDECDAAVTLFRRGLIQFAEKHDIEDPDFFDGATAAAEGFETFNRFLDGCSKQSGGYACGPEAFDLVLSDGHFFQQPASELLTEARDELTRCEQYLDDAASDVGVDSVAAAIARSEADHPTEQEYYDRYQEALENCRRVVENTDAVTWPDYPIEFVPQPKWVREPAENLYFLSYRAPAAFDDVSPVEYLVEPIESEMSTDEIEARLQRNNNAQIKATHVAHHGGVGHHVQNWNAYERAASRIGRFAAVDCASRIALYAGGSMAEGWACYATELMDELGFFEPLESYLLEYNRLRYAVRAIVDIELHHEQMSYEEAVDMYRNRAHMNEEAARYEATRNSMFPGMAVMYCLPLKRIHTLRETFETELGDDFDLGWFHEEFLSYGSIPVPMIADRMRQQHLQREPN